MQNRKITAGIIFLILGISAFVSDAKSLLLVPAVAFTVVGIALVVAGRRKR